MPDSLNSPRTIFEQGQARTIARRVAVTAADGLKVEGQMAADYAARFLRCMKEAGMRKDQREALRDTILDALSEVQGGINRELDEAGLHSDGHQIDLSEV